MNETKAKTSEKTETTKIFAARASTQVPAPSPLQSGFALTDMQQAAGNLAMQRFLRAGVIQAKLTVSSPGDMYEQEADRVADQVLSSAPIPSIQRKCAMCAEGMTCPKCQEEERLQAKESPGHTPHVTPRVESSLASLRGGGQPLAASLRAFFEPRFGQDFGGVRVHTGAAAADSAVAVHARAFTVGRDIVFGAGQYVSGTLDGKRLLAHELTHVVQQRGGMHAAVLQRQPANEEPTSEREGRTQVVPGSSSGSKTPTPEQIVALRAVQPKINALEGKADVVNASLSSMLAESDGLLAQIDGDLDTMTKKYQQAYKRHEAALKEAGTALAGDERIISIVVSVALGPVAGKMLEALGSVTTIKEMIEAANASMEAAGVPASIMKMVAGSPAKAAGVAARQAGKAVAGSESRTAVPQPGADPAARELKITTQISKLKSDVIRVARMAIDLKPLDKAATELVRDIALYIEKGSGTSVADPVDVVLKKADKLARHGKDAYDNAQKAIKDNWKGVRSMAASMSSAVSETSVDSLEERIWIEWIAGLDPKTQLSVLDKLEGGIDGRFLPQKVIELLGVNTGLYTTRSDLLKMHFNAQDAQRAQAQVGKSGTYIGPASKTTFRSGGRVYVGDDDFPARIEAVEWWPILAEEPNGRALSVVVVGTYNTGADAGTDTGSLKSRERFGLVVQAPAPQGKGQDVEAPTQY
jgi:hypothetical protein